MASMSKPVSITKKDDISIEKKDDLTTHIINSGPSMDTQKLVTPELMGREISILSHSTSISRDLSCDLSCDKPVLASETFTYQQISEKNTGPNDYSSPNPDECTQSSVKLKIDKETQQSGLKTLSFDLSSDSYSRF